ncbi:MAG: hypothetical protein ACRD4K_04670, partial [Candidatus Acidiferrales bacterium]
LNGISLAAKSFAYQEDHFNRPAIPVMGPINGLGAFSRFDADNRNSQLCVSHRNPWRSLCR